MVSFKQYLTESRSAPLYHGVSRLFTLQNILRSGLKPLTFQTSHKLLFTRKEENVLVKGVSTTRSFKFARWWGMGVIIELDQVAISQRYKIKPIQYFSDRPGHPARQKDYSGSSDNEYEEFIITNKPIPPKYFKRIWVVKKILDQNKEYFNEIRQQYGSDFIKVF